MQVKQGPLQRAQIADIDSILTPQATFPLLVVFCRGNEVERDVALLPLKFFNINLTSVGLVSQVERE